VIRFVAGAFAVGAAVLGVAALAQPVAVELPFGETPAELSDPASEVVIGNCSGCHSLDYITTQPRGKGEQFWRDAVTKMIAVYKAPVAAEDADAISRTLARKFG
jgi:hypothetical protein